MAHTKSINLTTALVMTASLILFGSVRAVTTDLPEIYKPAFKFEKAPTLENKYGKPDVITVSAGGKRECRVWIVDNNPYNDKLNQIKHCRARYKF